MVTVTPADRDNPNEYEQKTRVYGRTRSDDHCVHLTRVTTNGSGRARHVYNTARRRLERTRGVVR